MVTQTEKLRCLITDLLCIECLYVIVLFSFVVFNSQTCTQLCILS